MFMPKKLSLYITKDIIKKFLILYFGLFFLIFIIDFFEQSKDIENSSQFVPAFLITVYKIPNMLEIALNFILLIATLLTFYNFSNRSEIVIMRASGLSIFQIIKFPLFMAFLFGWFSIIYYNQLSSNLVYKSNVIKKDFDNKKNNDYIFFKNGFWFKQDNLEDGGSIMMRVDGVYKKLLLFKKAIIIFTDKNNNFVKRIDSSYLSLDKGEIVSFLNYVKKEGQKQEFVEYIHIKTLITQDFMLNNIEEMFKYTENVSFVDLPNAIKSLQDSGFSARKFQVRYYFFLTTPFLYSLMILIGAYFGIIHNRENRKFLSIIYGIVFGFLVFILNNVISALSSNNKLTLYDSNIFLVLTYFVIATILLLKKDKLSNL
ncbi:MAG: LptF/LptG family permease [Rickettsiales bacterium]|jgi:lipopolysaccharide export system permease protein|nr:LptF/LptG family permease [Rickettsiales bacterium]